MAVAQARDELHRGQVELTAVVRGQGFCQVISVGDIQIEFGQRLPAREVKLHERIDPGTDEHTFAHTKFPVGVRLGRSELSHATKDQKCTAALPHNLRFAPENSAPISCLTIPITSSTIITPASLRSDP